MRIIIFRGDIQVWQDKLDQRALSAKAAEDFSRYCRDIPDFPKQGVIFRDITNLLKNGPVFKRAIDALGRCYDSQKIDTIVSIEARGFIIGSALAYRLGSGLVPVRKKGKLPWRVYRQNYDLEYGQDQVEVHQMPSHRAKTYPLWMMIATGGTELGCGQTDQRNKRYFSGAWHFD
jgi:adenine phosphoribosyltransferase